MIWIWLKLALVALAKLFIVPPAPLRVIRRTDRCPGCGNRGITLKFVRLSDNKSHQDPAAYILCTCDTCTCSYYEEPVGVAKLPAV